MKTAIVLSGGGSRGDFQVGAVRYLYDHGIWPNIICSSSVGSINGIKLAACRYRWEGMACYVFGSPAPNRKPLYRLNNGLDRLYTTSESEKLGAINNFGYNEEGSNGYVYDTPVQGSKPLYRLNNGTNRLYTINEIEKTQAINNFGYREESIACYVFDSPGNDLVPLYRLVDVETQSRLYTLSPIEKDLAVYNIALQELESIWLSLQSNDEMFQEEEWFSTLGRGLKSVIRESVKKHDSSTKPFLADPIGILLQLGDDVARGIITWAQLGPDLVDLQKKFDRQPPPQAVFNLSPILLKLRDRSNLNSDLVRNSPVKLRMAVVGLESGALRYVTETGLLLNSFSGSRLFTTSALERELAIADHGMKSEGVACYVFDSPRQDRKALYRLNNGIDRLYTTSEIEKAQAINNHGYQDENIACYVYDKQFEGTVPFYRLVNSATQRRLFTTSSIERDIAVATYGWTNEQVACFVYAAPVDGTVSLYRLIQIANPDERVDIIEGVHASASIPGIFPPVKLLNENFVDGGVRELIPIQAAIDLGAERIIGIETSASISYSKETFDNAHIIEITARCVEAIMTDEILHNEIAPATGWGVPITVIQPAFDIHDIMTIDPGLIRISMAYGYMLAGDTMQGSREQQIRFRYLADQIVTLRKQIWDLEYEVNGELRPESISSIARAKSPEALRSVRKLKRNLKVIIEERFRIGGVLPHDAQEWWLNWERHPWQPLMATPWQSWNDYVRPSQYLDVDGAYLYTCSPMERQLALNEFGNTDEGVTGYVFDSPGADRKPLHRLNNGINRLYTTSEIEKTEAIENFGYSDEGITCYVFDKETPGTVPLFRLVNDKNFLFTTSAIERDFSIQTMGYRDQGITCWVFDSKADQRTELFRLVHPA